MTHSSRSGQSGSASHPPSPIPPRNGHDRTSPGQLSLLPEYTENNGHPEQNSNENDASNSASGSYKWLTVLGIVLLAVAGFVGWRWWQGRSSSEQSQQGPQATPVELATVETATVEDTSVFTGNLEAEQVTDVQAEQAGRIAQIFVQPGQVVSAGMPLFRLSAEQEQADVEAALARIDTARATQQQAVSELEALRAERDRVQAEVNLQQEQFVRTTTLVEEGALSLFLAAL